MRDCTDFGAPGGEINIANISSTAAPAGSDRSTTTDRLGGKRPAYGWWLHDLTLTSCSQHPYVSYPTRAHARPSHLVVICGLYCLHRVRACYRDGQDWCDGEEKRQQSARKLGQRQKYGQRYVYAMCMLHMYNVLQFEIHLSLCPKRFVVLLHLFQHFDPFPESCGDVGCIGPPMYQFRVEKVHMLGHTGS